MFRLSHVALFFVVLTSAIAGAQSLCPPGTTSGKLICLIPQLYGPNGLVLQNTNAQQLGVAPFQNSLPQVLNPVNSSIAQQTALLPLASPSSGITFAWDAAAKIYVASTDSYGPILAERADTIGKYKLFVGFSYQYFKFGSEDGIGLKNLPAVFTQPDTFGQNLDNGNGKTCSLSPPDSVANEGECGFIRDIVTSNNRIDLKAQQFTTFVTFGLTDRIDLSMAIPIETVKMSIVSDSRIRNISQTGDHLFPDRSDCSPCLTNSASNVGSASGIGDITFRVKGTAWRGEKAALALGVDIRVPTGDSQNFLGAGAAGFRPFLVWSYHARVSPHALVGYETNGSSVVAGDITTGRKDKLPGQLVYSGGADVWLTKWLSAAVDLVGQQVFQAPRLSRSTFVEPLACAGGVDDCNVLADPPAPTDPTLISTTGSYNVSSASLGVKIKPFGHLIVTANALLKLNEGGLRANVVPLIGASYTF